MKISIKTSINYSPNFSTYRRTKKNIKYLIFHYTGMNSESKAINRLTDVKSEVSCHYFIKRNGSIILIVPEAYEAWHAGKSNWKRDKSFYSFKTHPPWAVLSWPYGEDVLSKEFKIKSSEVVSNGSAIKYVIEYDGSFPDLFSQNTYSLFIEAECEPEGLNAFFKKPDCDCTENCEKICRTACFLK